MKALILSAGQGIRQKQNGDSKQLIPLLGLCFIERVYLTANDSGIKEFQIVIGCNGKRIQKYLGNGEKLGVNVDYIYNDEWNKGNGVSVFKAKDFMHDPFILLMAAHLFDHKILSALQQQTIEEDE